ncbi:hypothetical protein KIW84_042152 [Lathyrus oleraceus]|uniref:Uncharacterized protein n=1 Tax=Pisum sativum TaxID=3888 RepID=A0A9D4XDM4_PEA|nr:hypothetical protein KIW84_042152 [Pisum sativum]
MSGNGGENNKQAQGLFSTRGRTNERGQGRGALSKSIKPNDGDVTISKKQVIEIEYEDQPDSCHGQVENPIASEDEEEDERDHEEVQQENAHVLQQQ